MEYVLTLMAPPGRITRQMLVPVSGAMRTVGARTDTSVWLAEGAAWEQVYLGPAPALVEKHVRAAVSFVDVVAQPAEGRRKRLFVADMDSTIIGQECLDALAARAGVGDEVADLTRRAMEGEINFEEALRTRVRLLAGQPEMVLGETYVEDIHLSDGARTVVATLHAQGVATALVSGGFTFFTERIADAAGFDTCNGNRLAIADGVLTGEVEGEIDGAAAKAAMLATLAEEHGVDPKDSMAAGDGANDIPMLEAAGMGIAFHAKAKAVEAAKIRIDHAGLRALLYVQGYSHDEIVEEG